MTIVTTATAARFRSRSGSNIGAQFISQLTNMRKRMKDKRDARALRALDNRTLRDMGINRSEIISVVYADHDERRINHARH